MSRTIESAQTRVEGYNFDTRKHVVEYDDVINRQRETIYHERERILRSRTCRRRSWPCSTRRCARSSLEHTAGERPDDWNREGLKARSRPWSRRLGPADLAAIDEARRAARS